MMDEIAQAESLEGWKDRARGYKESMEELTTTLMDESNRLFAEDPDVQRALRSLGDGGVPGAIEGAQQRFEEQTGITAPLLTGEERVAPTIPEGLEACPSEMLEQLNEITHNNIMTGVMFDQEMDTADKQDCINAAIKAQSEGRIR
jgi:hypothetical protein